MNNLKIRLLWIGKTRSGFISEAIEHYLKMLRPFVGIKVLEINESRGLAKEAILDAEAKSILRASQGYILLDERGVELTSIGFSEFIKKHLEASRTIDFVFGGAFGVSEEVKRNAKQTLSLSKMTLPHEISRIVFLEQLYRALILSISIKCCNSSKTSGGM